MPESIAVADSSSKTAAAGLAGALTLALLTKNGIMTGTPVTSNTISSVLAVSCTKLKPEVNEVILLLNVGATGPPAAKSIKLYLVPVVSVTPLATRTCTCKLAGKAVLIPELIQPALLIPATQAVCPPSAVIVLIKRKSPAFSTNRLVPETNTLPCKSKVDTLLAIGANQYIPWFAFKSPPSITLELKDKPSG